MKVEYFLNLLIPVLQLHWSLFMAVDSRTMRCSVSWCPENWVRYENKKCFKYFETPLNQTAAQNACKGLTSNLASFGIEGAYFERTVATELIFLNTYAERESLSSGLPEAVWLGGRKSRDRWFWLDLSPYDVQEFRTPRCPHEGDCMVMNMTFLPKPEPPHSNHERNEDCSGMTIRARNCGQSHPYICQKFYTDSTQADCSLMQK